MNKIVKSAKKMRDTVNEQTGSVLRRLNLWYEIADLRASPNISYN